MELVRLFFHSIKLQMKSKLQYPASFLMQTVAQLVMEGGELLVVLLLIHRFGHLKKWGGGDILVFFGVMSVTFYLTEIFCRGITGNFEMLIRNGTLDTMLTRPRGILTQMICQDTDPRRITCVAVGIVAIVRGSQLSGLVWTPLKLLALAEAVACGILLIIALFLIEAVFSIYSVKSLEMVNALTYGGRSACEYPVDIYPQFIQVVFSIVAPFSLTLHAPVSYILGKPLFGWPDWTAFACPLAGVCAFFFMRFVLYLALRHYRSTGS